MVMGLLLDKFYKHYKNVEKLPITQIPSIIQENDKNLMYQPYYKLTKKNNYLFIGPKVVTLSNVNEYAGWEKFLLEFNKVIHVMKDINFIHNITQVSLRYISFFENTDIFEKIKLKVNYEEKEFRSTNTFFRIEINKDEIISILQLSNSANFINKHGSLFDIDNIKKPNNKNFDAITDFINNSHTREKKIFFGLLKEEYLQQTFKPLY